MSIGNIQISTSSYVVEEATLNTSKSIDQSASSVKVNWYLSDASRNTNIAERYEEKLILNSFFF